MTQTKLHMTIFEIEKLKNIVGFGSGSPYQITTYMGGSLGMIGTVMDPANIQASNGEYTVPEPAVPASLFQRVLSASGLKRS